MRWWLPLPASRAGRSCCARTGSPRPNWPTRCWLRLAWARFAEPQPESLTDGGGFRDLGPYVVVLGRPIMHQTRLAASGRYRAPEVDHGHSRAVAQAVPPRL